MDRVKKLYYYVNDEGNYVIQGVVIDKRFLNMFTNFLCLEVYKMPIKYIEITNKNFVDFLEDEDA